MSITIKIMGAMDLDFADNIPWMISSGLEVGFFENMALDQISEDVE